MGESKDIETRAGWYHYLHTAFLSTGIAELLFLEFF